jgi:hypothetical protein
MVVKLLERYSTMGGERGLIGRGEAEGDHSLCAAQGSADIVLRQSGTYCLSPASPEHFSSYCLDFCA